MSQSVAQFDLWSKLQLFLIVSKIMCIIMTQFSLMFGENENGLHFEMVI